MLSSLDRSTASCNDFVIALCKTSKAECREARIEARSEARSEARNVQMAICALGHPLANPLGTRQPIAASRAVFLATPLASKQASQCACLLVHFAAFRNIRQSPIHGTMEHAYNVRSTVQPKKN